jgi:hypothetical protein
MERFNKSFNGNTKGIPPITEKIQSVAKMMDFHKQKIQELKTPAQISFHSGRIDFLNEIREMLIDYRTLKKKQYANLQTEEKEF